jgi:hypothetical protein
MKNKLFKINLGYEKNPIKSEPEGYINEVNPFVMSYVYPDKGEPFIVTGSRKRVEKHLKIELNGSPLNLFVMTTKYFAAKNNKFETTTFKFQTTKFKFYFQNPKLKAYVLNRDINRPLYEKENAISSKRKDKYLTIFLKDEIVFQKKFRQMPKCFPKEISEVINEHSLPIMSVHS